MTGTSLKTRILLGLFVMACILCCGWIHQWLNGGSGVPGMLTFLAVFMLQLDITRSDREKTS